MSLKPPLDGSATENSPTQKAESTRARTRFAQRKTTLSTPNVFLAERTASEAGTQKEQEREECCRQIGQLLRQIRQEKALSIQGLYSKTYVPAHQIQAIEEGRTEDLPEDVYLRSFIRQLGNALGLNGMELAASLPMSKPSIVPTWYDSSTSLDLSIPSAYLYFGYAAVLAGSLGGLSWASERSAYETYTERQQTSLEQESDRAQANATTASRTTANVAPPEMLHD
ncbi:MAG: helix-turn-helix transcriptional regulator [Cyanobacteriota bacterium]|nr:helix-turn-helix transcriptional regulator [Cyanobacteriota bacterium]